MSGRKTIESALGLGSFASTCLSNHSDLVHPESQRQFQRLSAFSDRYLADSARLGVWPAAYNWPRDALRCNTRLWEYPFVAAAVERHCTTPVRLLDIGSALTFLPAYFASLGHDVVASDVDRNVIEWAETIWTSLRRETDWAPGRLRYQLLDVTRDVPACGPFDVVTNVSVLEHLPAEALAQAVKGLASALRDGGLLVNTVDCWIAGPRTPGHSPLDTGALAELLEIFGGSFDIAEPVALRLPNDILTNRNAPGEVLVPTKSIWQVVKATLRGARRSFLAERGNPVVAAEWCALGVIMKKREATGPGLTA